MIMQLHNLQDSNFLQQYTKSTTQFLTPRLQMNCKPYWLRPKEDDVLLWHDHATILSTGFLMITVHTLYDPAVFLTNSEDQQYTQSAVDIQTEVEKPEIYMLALGSSSIEDQAAVLPDRIDCLHELAEPVVTTSGIKVYDTLWFFIGDHPAA